MELANVCCTFEKILNDYYLASLWLSPEASDQRLLLSTAKSLNLKFVLEKNRQISSSNGFHRVQIWPKKYTLRFDSY